MSKILLRDCLVWFGEAFSGGSSVRRNFFSNASVKDVILSSGSRMSFQLAFGSTVDECARADESAGASMKMRLRTTYSLQKELECKLDSNFEKPASTEMSHIVIYQNDVFCMVRSTDGWVRLI